MRRSTIVAMVASGVVLLGACSADEKDFKDEGESYIESEDFTSALEGSIGVAVTFTDASCDEPSSTDVGTTYTCTATGDDGVEYTFEVEITDDSELTVQNIDPIPGG
jgi:hypothetical protein